MGIEARVTQVTRAAIAAGGVDDEDVPGVAGRSGGDCAFGGNLPPHSAGRGDHDMAGVGSAGFVANGDKVARIDVCGAVDAGKAAFVEDRGEVVSGQGALGAEKCGELGVFEVVGVGKEGVGEAAAIGLAGGRESWLRGIGKDDGGGAVLIEGVGGGGVADERPGIVQMRRDGTPFQPSENENAEEMQHAANGIDGARIAAWQMWYLVEMKSRTRRRICVTMSLSLAVIAVMGIAGQSVAGVEVVEHRKLALTQLEAASEIRPLDYRAVKFTPGSFWGERLEAIRKGTLKANRHQCEITGRLANFDRAAAKIRGEKEPGEFQGLLFNDSDVYKMVEGWCYLVATTEDAAERATLEKDLDGLIARIAAAQYPDGYINTYFTLKKGVENRLTNEGNDHETYCIGHLIEAGVAHFQATGKRTLLDVAIRAADFVVDVYGKGFSVPPGHQEVELALIRLQDALPKEAKQDGKYLAMAEKLIELRGRPRRTLDGKEHPPAGEYAQDHVPVAEQMEAAGHAVRAVYLYCAMTDLAVRGKGKYVTALDSLWDDITGRRMFVTGGIGPSAHNEGFTTPYDIPTHSAYQETCASIGVCLWAQRMFELHGEAKYFDQFERTLFNAALAGVSLDGEKFFYVNPLASRGAEARREWFSCACCPPNVLRFFGSLAGQCYAVRGSTLYVNLFASSTMDCVVDGQSLRVEQETEYPYDGAVKLKIRHGGTRPITLAVRCPQGQKVEGLPECGDSCYAEMEIKPGEHEVAFALPMDVRRVYADPRAKQLAGMAAIMRGPLVYAAEIVRNSDQRAQAPEDLSRVALTSVRESAVVLDSDGVPELMVGASDCGHALLTQRDDVLYQAGPDGKQIEMRMRPYFTWANHGSARMAVWFADGVFALPRSRGIEITASHVWSRDSADAVADGQEPGSSGDQSIPRLTFWPHKGTEEWMEARFFNSRKVSSVSVYWFDDAGAGACRTPAEWTIQVRGKDGKWIDASGDVAGPGRKDNWDARSIQPVQTQAIRIRIKQREGFSSGILEIKVN